MANESRKESPAKTKNGGRVPAGLLNPQQVFLGAVLSMSWQLAIVVLIPILAGYYLDQNYNSSPVYTIIGSVVAVIGAALIIRKVLRFTSPPLPKKEDH